MIHILPVVILLATASAASAGALDAAISRAIAACRHDAHLFCASAARGGLLATAECLQAHSSEISLPCREALLALVEVRSAS